MEGRTSTALAAVVSAVVALLAVVAFQFDTSEEVEDPLASPSREVVVPDPVPVEPADLPTLGVQYHGTWSFQEDAKQRKGVLDKIAASGAEWVRLDVGWSMIQPNPDGFDMNWGVPRVDEVMDELRARDLKVLAMFWLTPDWAREGDNEFAPPDDADDYAQALGWAAERWGDAVDAWQVWNEPNLDVFFEGTDAAVYTELLCAGNDILKDVAPDDPVVLGGLIYNDIEWLDDAYEAGVAGCFDVLGVHAYSGPADAPPSSQAGSDEWNLRNLAIMDRIMRREGDRKPIWITEFGWSTHELPPDVEPWRRGVTPQQQAEYARDALEIIAEEFPYVEVAFWYKDVENPWSTDVHQEGYALLEQDLTPRPVYNTLRRLYEGRR